MTFPVLGCLLFFVFVFCCLLFVFVLFLFFFFVLFRGCIFSLFVCLLVVYYIYIYIYIYIFFFFSGGGGKPTWLITRCIALLEGIYSFVNMSNLHVSFFPLHILRNLVYYLSLFFFLRSSRRDI